MADQPQIHYIDLETFGLDPDEHAVWEIAVVDDLGPYSFFIKPKPYELMAASPQALKLTHYYERMRDESRISDVHNTEGQPGNYHVKVEDRPVVALHLARRLTGWLAGNAVHFDELRLGKFIRDNGAVPIWDHHLLDVETYAAGVLGLPIPWKASEISEKLEIPQPQGKHAAGVDAQWSKELYERALALVEGK